jgi:hypothetical protein
MAALVFPTTKGACNPALSPAGDPVATGDTTLLDNGIIYIATVVGGVNEWSALTSPTPSLEATFVEVAGDHMTGNLTIGGTSGDPKITLDATGTTNITGDATFGAKLITGDLDIYAGGGVEPTAKAITAGEFDLRKGVTWTAAAIDIPNPTNGVAGMTGQILCTAAPSSWGSAFKFPGGVNNVQPTTATYPAIVPYLVQNSGVILLGTPISY